MRKPSDSKTPRESKQTASVDRRHFFMMGGSAAAAAAVVPLAGGEAVADDESRAERVKARYRQTDHVNNYYRVNRY
ncbi:hypothetical protein [uncultured Bradyrhizobium sp.]|uniref:hypothetical protein n=1 Tax=uncultured Bradyrhizobium sp. TaxID=199684 RepID=UPI0035CBBF78